MFEPQIRGTPCKKNTKGVIRGDLFARTRAVRSYRREQSRDVLKIIKIDPLSNAQTLLHHEQQERRRHIGLLRTTGTERSRSRVIENGQRNKKEIGIFGGRRAIMYKKKRRRNSRSENKLKQRQHRHEHIRVYISGITATPSASLSS